MCTNTKINLDSDRVGEAVTMVVQSMTDATMASIITALLSHMVHDFTMEVDLADPVAQAAAAFMTDGPAVDREATAAHLSAVVGLLHSILPGPDAPTRTIMREAVLVAQADGPVEFDLGYVR